MNDDNRRISPRLRSLNLLDFVVVDAHGAVLNEALARTLNVSDTGLLMETSEPLTSNQLVHVTLGLEDDLVDLEGRVVRVSLNEQQLYQAGIEFGTIDPVSRATLLRYLEAFHHQHPER